ncbi:MAG TPA: ABC transporter permease [Acidimicrobiales bacterium]|nr:ABC transporter permease [Acidimicrobiales bacterium]
MTALQRLTRTEAVLFLRDKAQVFFVLVLPLALVLGFGSSPGTREASEDFDGEVPLDALIAPLAVAVLLAIVAYNVVPTHVVSYREKGVLRRLSASPVRASTLLAAVVLVKIAAALVSLVLLLVVGGVLVDLSLPAASLWFVLVFVLALASLFSLSMVLAARIPTASAATGIGMALFFPSMFLAGVYVPREHLPDVLGRIGELTPLGAALQAMRDTWIGDAPSPLHVVVLAASALLLGTIASRTFRWE